MTTPQPDRGQSMIRPHAPDGWLVKESWTLLAPDGQANVIASREPIDQAMTTAQYAAVQAELLSKEFPQYVEHAFVLIVTPQGPVPLRVFEWTPPGGTRVRQHQVYWVRPGQGFTMTATSPVGMAEGFADVFHDVLTRTAFS